MKFLVWGSKGTAPGLDLLVALLGSLGHVVGYRNPQFFSLAELERPDGVILLEADTDFERVAGQPIAKAIWDGYEAAGVRLAGVGKDVAAAVDLAGILAVVGPALGPALQDPRLALFLPPAAPPPLTGTGTAVSTPVTNTTGVGAPLPDAGDDGAKPKKAKGS